MAQRRAAVFVARFMTVCSISLQSFASYITDCLNGGYPLPLLLAPPLPLLGPLVKWHSVVQ